jgi:hypothetical protein
MAQSNAFKFANNILTNGGYDAADLVGAVAGQVIQVVQKVIGDNVGSSGTSTTSTWLDNQDAGSNILSQSITPSSASNKILILASCFTHYETGTQGNAGETFARILNGASSIFTSTSGFIVGYDYTGTTSRYGTFWNIGYLHSPNSTSSQTYKVQYRFEGLQDFYYGENDTLTLMEIKG